MNLESALFRGLGSLLSPAGHKGKLAILIYHRILSSPDPAGNGTMVLCVRRLRQRDVGEARSLGPAAPDRPALGAYALPATALSLSCAASHAA